MKRRGYSMLGLSLLAVLFLVFNFVNGLLFETVRLDLTENQLFTLDEGSKRIVDSIEEPIKLYYFYSKKAAQGLPQLNNYAQRVQSLLEEYALYGKGKIELQIIDPEPFSEAEDLATSMGLQSVPLNGGEAEHIFFGVAGSNALDGQSAIAFLQPEQEDVLEYELSKLIHNLANPELPVVGILSSLEMQGGFDMMTQQPSAPWQIMAQIQQLYETRNLNNDIETIDDDIRLLLLVQPEGLSDQAAYAIDQYVMRGGKVMLFLDPVAEAGRGMPYLLDDKMQRLLAAWGVRWEPSVVQDGGKALVVSLKNGEQVRHLTIAGYDRENLSQSDVITNGLENVTVASTGYWQRHADAETTMTPLISSSSMTMLMPSVNLQMRQDPALLLKDFKPGSEVYPIMVRVHGAARSAFSDKAAEGHVAQAENINLVLVADTDLLTDRLWVQVQDFMGQQVATPWADNGGLIINALDNLAGSADLIGIRSRGQYSRPFLVVDELRRQAEMRFRDHEEQLQSRLSEVEQKMAELQRQKSDASNFMLSPEQEQALLQFQGETLAVRKQLREVRHQLDRDIETLGGWLKAINIGLVPILVTLLALLIRFGRRRHARMAQPAGGVHHG